MPKKKKPIADTAMHWDELFDREFKNESDRASVILAAAMLDNVLDTLLRAKLAPVSTGQDTLLDGHNSPIASFSARIDLTYRVGVISDKMARDLHIIRRIRNEFAHNIVGCSFDSPSVRSRVVELTRSSGFAERNKSIRRRFPDGPRGDFQFATSWMLWSLTSHLEDVSPIDAAPHEFGYTEGDEPEEA
jgi:hypothetical protein